MIPPEAAVYGRLPARGGERLVQSFALILEAAGRLSGIRDD